MGRAAIGTVALIDMETRRRKATIRNERQVAFSPDGKLLAIVRTRPRTIRGDVQALLLGDVVLTLYDGETGKKLTREFVRESVEDVVFVADGQAIATGGGKLLSVFALSDLLADD